MTADLDLTPSGESDQDTTVSSVHQDDIDSGQVVISLYECLLFGFKKLCVCILVPLVVFLIFQQYSYDDYFHLYEIYDKLWFSLNEREVQP